VISVSKRMSAVLAVFLAFVISAPAVVAQSAVVDVPRDHWAYDAVNLMISKGYMEVYESGRFSGDDPVSRYLLAFVVARLLQDVEAGRTALSEDDMRVLREISTTLREQLAVVISRLSELERMAADASAEAIAAKDSAARGALDTAAKYAELKAAIESQRAELDAQIKVNAEAADQKLSVLFGDLRNQHADLKDSLGQSIAAQQEKLAAVEASAQSALAAERSARAELEQNLTLSLSSLKNELSARIDSVSRDQSTLGSTLTSQIAAVKADLDAAKVKHGEELGSLQVRIDEVTSAVVANRAWAEAAIQDAVTKEAAARAAQDESLDRRLANIEAGLVSAAQATESEAAARTVGLEALNQRVSALAVDLSTTKGQTASQMEQLRLALDAESAERVESYAALLERQDKMQQELDAKVAVAMAEAMAAAQAAMGAVELEKAARTADVDDLGKKIDAVAQQQADAEQRLQAQGRALNDAKAELSAALAELAARQDQSLQAATSSAALSAAALKEAIEKGLADEKAAREAAIAQEAALRQQQIEAEAAARQKQAGEILAQLAATAGSVADLDRKTADADAAILAAMELEKERLTKTKEELAQLTDVVNELDALLAQTQAQLDALSNKHTTDYNQQRQALVDMRVAMDQLSKQFDEKLTANAAQDARTAAMALQNSINIEELVEALNETRDVLNQTMAALDSTDKDVEGLEEKYRGLEERLASMEKILEGSLDELAARFSDELIAERWEAEAREIKLQQRIEDLERRVEQLEGGRASTGSPGTLWALLGVAAAVAGVALLAGAGAP